VVLSQRQKNGFFGRKVIATATTVTLSQITGKNKRSVYEVLGKKIHDSP
jgi:hypothetical protein